jgi:FKBP-type peptidyl-prolyl cis-trans isomerase
MKSHSWRIGVLAFYLGLMTACSGKPDGNAADVPAPAVSALQAQDLEPGAGAPIEAGKQAVVQYTGWLYDTSAADHKGRQFDSSRTSGQPFRFVIGAGQVIKGWDQGVLGMKIGGKRRLVIPPDLGYGSGGAGDAIPPGATLVFDVELVGIE